MLDVKRKAIFGLKIKDLKTKDRKSSLAFVLYLFNPAIVNSPLIS